MFKAQIYTRLCSPSIKKHYLKINRVNLSLFTGKIKIKIQCAKKNTNQISLGIRSNKDTCTRKQNEIQNVKNQNLKKLLSPTDCSSTTNKYKIL